VASSPTGLRAAQGGLLRHRLGFRPLPRACATTAPSLRDHRRAGVRSDVENVDFFPNISKKILQHFAKY
jgi:hypothetical protein